jgi:hypothetical protein
MAENEPEPDPLAARKALTFAQAEGLEPLPSQMAPRQISQEFRAVLWSTLKHEFGKHRVDSHLGGGYLRKPWSTILEEAHVYHHHQLSEFPHQFTEALATVKRLVERGSWSEVLGWLEFVLKHPACPRGFPRTIDAIMAHCRLAYRVLDGKVISPIASDTERETIERAFADLRATEFNGARTHLQNAARELSAGNYADSVRETIHAVEAVARVLEPSAELSKALGRLQGSANIHGGMKKAFLALYGYASDEKGIRHPLLDDGTAKVDEVDALFMIGACASFVSYLINKARAAGLLVPGANPWSLAPHVA